MTIHQNRYVGGDKSDVKKCRDYAENIHGIDSALNPYIGYSKSADRVKDAIRA